MATSVKMAVYGKVSNLLEHLGKRPAAGLLASEKCCVHAVNSWMRAQSPLRSCQRAAWGPPLQWRCSSSALMGESLINGAPLMMLYSVWDVQRQRYSQHL